MTNASIKAIGPRIGFTNEFELKVMISLPFNAEINSLKIEIFDENKLIFSQQKSPQNFHFNNYLFCLPRLETNKKYRYEFLYESNKILIENLNDDELFFYSPKSLHSQNICSLSCNNPFKFDDKSFDRFNMWKKLDETINREKTGLVIYAGDQVYNDDLETEILENIYLNQSLTEEEKNNKTRLQFINNYYKFWENKHIKRIHAQIPSLMIWDDHDITDGWGGREESFDLSKNFKPEWLHFFKYAKEAFEELQSICNPSSLSPSTYSTFLDIGPYRFYLMDFRSEKNIHKKVLLSDSHLNDFFNSFDSLNVNIKHVVIVSPVVPIRINLKMEEHIENTSKDLYGVRTLLNLKNDKKNSTPLNFISKFFAKAKEAIIQLLTKSQIPDLSDDISDGLTSNENRQTLIKILNYLIAHQVTKRNICFLTGDIHAGGWSEFIIQIKGNYFSIPQIVSSPIGYAPMITTIKDITTEDNDIVLLSTDEIKIIGRNIKYISSRNFSFIEYIQNKLQVSSYFEKDVLPYAFSPSTFTTLVDDSTSQNTLLPVDASKKATLDDYSAIN